MIANFTLDGLQAAVNTAISQIGLNMKIPVYVIRYADDFMITGPALKMQWV